MVDEFFQEVTIVETPLSLMDRVIINLNEQAEDECEIELSECLLQLQATQVNKATRKIEELGGVKQEIPILIEKYHELKRLLKHLKYVFLGEKPLQSAIISSSLSTIEE